MKKYLLSIFFIVLFMQEVPGKSSWNFNTADGILVTFLNSPDSKIDTTIIIKGNYTVTFKGSYQLATPVITFDVVSNHKNIFNHYEDVITKGFGITSYKNISFYFHSNKIHVSLIGEDDLKNTTLIHSYQNSKRLLAEKAHRERVVRDSLYNIERIRKAEERRVYIIKRDRDIKELDSLRLIFINDNNIKNEYKNLVESSLKELKYWENYITSCERKRFNEVDALEKQYIGRLEGEIFLTKKAELNAKWENKLNEASLKVKGIENSITWYEILTVEKFNSYIKNKGYNYKFGYYTVQHINKQSYIEINFQLAPTHNAFCGLIDLPCGECKITSYERKNGWGKYEIIEETTDKISFIELDRL